MLEALSARLATLPEQEFVPGQALLRSGTRTGRLLFLKCGEVEVKRDGVTVTRIREPGAVFGENGEDVLERLAELILEAV